MNFNLPLKPQIAAYINQMNPPLVIKENESKYNVIIDCEEPGGGGSACENGMDVLFLVDYTSSMDISISEIKNSLLNDNGFLQPIIDNSGGNYRLGLAIIDEYFSSENPRYFNSNFYNELNTNDNVYINNGLGFNQYISLIVDFSDQNVEIFKNNVKKILKDWRYFVKINLNGDLDNDLNVNNNFNNAISTITTQLDNKILIGGGFIKYQGKDQKFIIRLNENGTKDNTFNTGDGFNNNVNIIVLQTDNKILIGGEFRSYKSIEYNRIIRLNTDGSVDNTFNIGTGFDNIVNIITIQNDNKILIGGFFTIYKGVSKKRIIRLNTDGNIDNTFNIGDGFNQHINTIVIQIDGKILVGGMFTNYNGATSNRIIRLNTDGSIDNTFNIGDGFNDTVNSITLQTDGKIIVGGEFTTYNTITYNRIIRLNTDGSVDNTFDIGTGFDDDVYTITIQTDNKILVGGTFTTYNTSESGKIVRLNSNGIKDNTFDIGTGFSFTTNTGSINVIKLYQSTNLLIGGNFLTYKGGVDSFPIGNGRALPEPYDVAIDVCVNGTPYTGSTRTQFMQPFRNNVNKQIILICDNLPSGNDDIFNQNDIDFITGDLKNSVISNNIKLSILTSLEQINSTVGGRLFFTETFTFNGIRTFTLTKKIANVIEVYRGLTTVPDNSITIDFINNTVTISDSITLALGTLIKIEYYYNPLLDIVYESGGVYSINYNPENIEEILISNCEGTGSGGTPTTIYIITGAGLSGDQINACINFNPNQILYTYCSTIGVDCVLYYDDAGSNPVLNVKYASINNIIYELNQTTGKIITILSFTCDQIIETFQYNGVGYGNTSENACNDATFNNKTLYSNCNIITSGCTIYFDSNGITPLTGFTYIFINNQVWDINTNTGSLVQISTIQCSNPTIIYTQINTGYGNTSIEACDDATINNRVLYSDCSIVSSGCEIYTNISGTTLLTGYTQVYIDDNVWDINDTTGIIIGLSFTQCPSSGLIAYTNSGYGNTVSTACNDAIINNRTLYSNCENIGFGCEIYLDINGTTPLTGYNNVFIEGSVWDLNLTNIIQAISVVQC